jgi:hypothetical protein
MRMELLVVFCMHDTLSSIRMREWVIHRFLERLWMSTHLLPAFTLDSLLIPRVVNYEPDAVHYPTKSVVLIGVVVVKSTLTRTVKGRWFVANPLSN